MLRAFVTLWPTVRRACLRSAARDADCASWLRPENRGRTEESLVKYVDENSLLLTPPQ